MNSFGGLFLSSWLDHASPRLCYNQNEEDKNRPLPVSQLLVLAEQYLDSLLGIGHCQSRGAVRFDNVTKKPGTVFCVLGSLEEFFIVQCYPTFCHFESLSFRGIVVVATRRRRRRRRHQIVPNFPLSFTVIVNIGGIVEFRHGGQGASIVCSQTLQNVLTIIGPDSPSG